MNYAEEAFFFQSSGLDLYGVWCAPDEPPEAALLYCHPFGEEKKCAHRAFVETARCLAAAGVASLRFDLGGCGDSAGDFAEATFEGWTANIESAWNEMRRRAPGTPRVLLGLRMGGALAALACTRLKDVRALILWQPVLSGEEEFTREIQRVLVQQMFTTGRAVRKRDELVTALSGGAIELDGYPISSELYADIAEFELRKTRLAFPRQSAVVQFGRPQKKTDTFIAIEALRGGVVDAPPIWRRIDFIAGAEAGRRLANDGILKWI